MKLNSGQYYGEIFQAMDSYGIILTRSDYAMKTVLPQHFHNNPYFCFVLDGTYTEHSFRNEITCTKGDIIFHPRETEHYNQFKNVSASCFNIELSGSWLEKIFLSKLQQKEISSCSHFETQSVFRKIYHEFIDADNLSALMIEGLTMELIVNFSRGEKKSISSTYYIRKVRKYIQEIFPSNPSLTELANLFHISPEYLARVFKKCTGVTIGEYIRHFKIEKACEKLKDKKADIHGIALECGFTDQSHFTKVFKNIMHITPGMYLATNSPGYTKISNSYN